MVRQWFNRKLHPYVHEHNEGMELIGVQFEVDLRKVRWFESAIQEMDEDAMMKYRKKALPASC